jgi:hypothetical protein
MTGALRSYAARSVPKTDRDARTAEVIPVSVELQRKAVGMTPLLAT